MNTLVNRYAGTIPASKREALKRFAKTVWLAGYGDGYHDAIGAAEDVAHKTEGAHVGCRMVIEADIRRLKESW